MFGDIGIGILISIFVSKIYLVEITPVLVVWGVISALLPDIDLVVFLFPTLKNIFGKHRGLTHYPIIYIPIVILLFIFIGRVYTLILALGIFLHLAHDSLWIGSGIQWRWPFSKKSYKFFNIERPYEPGPNVWIKEFYLRPTRVVISEVGVFLLSLTLLYMYIR